MKYSALLFAVLLCTTTATARGQNGGGYYDGAASPPARFGMGVQVASSPLLLFSWQGADENPYGRSWRIEPMIGFTYSDNETNPSYFNTSMSLTLGLGYYLRWRVRYPFDNLYFTMGPRATVTGYKTRQEYQNANFVATSQYLSTNLSLLAGPEYAIDGHEAHFTVAGYFSLGAGIRSRVKFDPSGSNSPWSFSITTGTGIMLRYYFK